MASQSIRKNQSSDNIFNCKNEEEDKILGLDLGADDYITKPFSARGPHELIPYTKK